MSQFNFGNVEGSAIIEGLGKGLDQAAQNLYTIQQNKQKMDLEQQKADNETDYKHAQVDYLEGKGQLAGAQADSYRFLINRAGKQQDAAIQNANDHLDNAQSQVQQQGNAYRQLLNQALTAKQQQDQEGQTMSGASDTTGNNNDDVGAGPSVVPPNAGSSTVNNIMPGVGSQQQQQQNVPVSSQGVGTQLNKIGGAGSISAGHRNASLQRTLGKIDAMGITDRSDAEEMLKRQYGADYTQQPDAMNFLNQKFGNGAAATSGTTTGQGNSAATPQQDMVSVTGPDGTPYQLPRANLQKALSRGYKQVGQ